MSTAAREISACLKDIHDHKLWQDDYPTFEAYCSGKLGLTRQRAYQMIAAQDARTLLMDLAGDDAALKDTASKLNDRQAAELVGVPAGKAVAVLQAAVTTTKATGTKLTANAIKLAKAAVVDPGTGKAKAPSAQLEFSFAIEAPTDDIEWFKKLTPADRGEIIAKAHRVKMDDEARDKQHQSDQRAGIRRCSDCDAPVGECECN